VLIRSYKYRLYPNKETAQQLQWVLDRCRELYNASLSERKDAWKYARKSINYYDQQNDLPEIKQIREEYKDIAAHVLQNVLRRVDLAFRRFFERVKNGERAGFPRFKGPNQYNSITYPDHKGWKLKENKLHFAKIGTAKVVLHRPIAGKIKTLTVKREADQWYVVFACEVLQPEPLPISCQLPHS